MRAATDYHSRRPSKARAYKKKLLLAISAIKGSNIYFDNSAAKLLSEPSKHGWLSHWFDNDKAIQGIKLSLKD